MPSRALWVTDIHMNFVDSAGREAFFDAARAHAPDALLISGDIGEAPTLTHDLQQMEAAFACPIYFVLGNHDFYRGSMAGVHADVRTLVKTSRHLYWMNDAGVRSLSPDTALVGHGSWADGRYGDFFGTPIELNDFHYIEELKTPDKRERLARMQALAEDAADHFRAILPRAFKRHRNVIVLTHVPPFQEACRRDGQIWGPDWLPFFSCKAVGDVLKTVMQDHPTHECTVLCGHTHSHAVVRVLPNLHVLTGRAEYRDPRPQAVLDV